MTAIALTVDARDITSDVFPDGDIRQFLNQWRGLEKMLRGQVLQAGVSFPVRVEDGEFRMEVVSPLTPVRVDEHTEFGIVAVREKPSVRSVYQCATCRRERKRTYGPFICQQCPPQDRRVCDLHAVVLPGSLIARCPQHWPDCQGCGATAAIWCPGPRCGGRTPVPAATAWCRSHSAAHTSEPETSYCLPCLAELFPPCGFGRCDKVGSINCDHLTRDGRLCDARRCPRHSRRWQVFGPHAEGLGRCEDHAHLRGLSAEELLYQVLGACAARQSRQTPSLAGLRHMLMKLTERNRDMREVYDLATRSPAAAPPALQRQIGDLVASKKGRWWKDVTDGEESLERRTAQLKDWLNRRGDYRAASYLEGKHWVRPRDDRTGTLYVTCDARLLPRPLRDAASAALGFDVRLETRA